MEALILNLIADASLAILFAVIALSLLVLTKGADLLVEEAVALSVSWGVPKMLIGATIVSLGTTLPEASVSVLAALRGSPGLALGNAVGSIIADTGLILGLALLLGPVPIEHALVRRQSWIQFTSAVVLVVVCVPFLQLETILIEGGRMPRAVGFVFLVLLALYIWRSIKWSASEQPPAGDVSPVAARSRAGAVLSLLKLIAGIALVVAASQVLIPTVELTALRLRVPESVIAATLVAFGTSLPELVTAITAVRRGHGDLALGNVIGADILNVLFVSGAAAAATPGGLQVPPPFFYLYFPSLIFVVSVLRIGIWRSRTELRRGFGFVLLAAYILTVIAGYVVSGVPTPTH